MVKRYTALLIMSAIFFTMFAPVQCINIYNLKNNVIAIECCKAIGTANDRKLTLMSTTPAAPPPF